jgi:glycosyltransferase involved in cell wall biosynthesis
MIGTGSTRTHAIRAASPEPLRIAQVAPLYESVPPRLYGGTERVVYYLTEELIRLGHHVTLFASGDSHTHARLVSSWDRALRLDERQPSASALHILLIEEVFRRASAFDVIHFHTDTIHLPLARRHNTPCVTTLHGRLDVAGLDALFHEYDELPLVSISRAQRRPQPHANWIATVHHGLPIGLHRPRHAPGSYLAFLGRLSPEKCADRAIEIAHRSGVPLRIAAKIDANDRDFYHERIAHLIDGSFISYVGEVNEQQKGEFLANALALVFPIDWPEPFGLAMIEAMACGTPVIAFPGGAVEEVIDEGVTGRVVDNIDAAVASVHEARTWDRRRCRAMFEKRFSATRMARDYARVYERLARSVAWRQSS